MLRSCFQWQSMKENQTPLQNTPKYCHCKKHSFNLTRVNLQNWWKWYLTTLSLPSDDFASIGNKDDSLTPNISMHRHTMQILRQLFTDLHNSGCTAKIGPFLSVCGELPPPKRASNQKNKVNKGFTLSRSIYCPLATPRRVSQFETMHSCTFWLCYL